MPQLLNAQFLSTALPDHQVFVFDSVNSTNQFLLDHLADLDKGTICTAEQQTAGRGRRGRQWRSPFGGQIILSLYWQFDAKKSVEGLSSVIGLAIVDCLKRYGAKDIGLKWPNDILLKGRKLAGILVELGSHKNGQLNVVIGIGLNLDLGSETKIDQPWAELKEILPHFDRNQLIVELTRHTTDYLTAFEQQGMCEKWIRQWLDWDLYFGEEVNIVGENAVISGIEQGIDERGYVRIFTAQGLQCFNAGEVSLRKKSG